VNDATLKVFDEMKTGDNVKSKAGGPIGSVVEVLRFGGRAMVLVWFPGIDFGVLCFQSELEPVPSEEARE